MIFENNKEEVEPTVEEPTEEVTLTEEIENTDTTDSETPKTNIFKNKKVIAGIIAIIVIVAVVVGLVVLNKDKLTVIADSVTVEYGETISTDAKDYVSGKADVLKNAEVVITDEECGCMIKSSEDTDVDADTEENVDEDKNIDKSADDKADKNKEKDYEEVGAYKAEITYEDETVTVSIEVKDTTAPVIGGAEEILIEVGTDSEDVKYKKAVTAEDLSEFDITYNDEDVKYNKEGEYTLLVTATDIYENIAEKEVPVIVADEETIAEETEKLNSESSSSSSGSSTSSGTTSSTSSYVYSPSSSTSSDSSNSSSSSTSSNSSSTSGTSSSSSSSNNSSSSSSSNSSSSSSGSSSSSTTCSMPIGDMGGWYSSSAELDAVYSAELAYWQNQHESGAISWEEYTANCPGGYSGYECECGWSGNYKYR